MPLELIEDAKGDPRNAQALAVASDLAYLPEAEGVEAFRAQLGMEAKFLTAGNTQAYVASNDDHIVVAFRGTEMPNVWDGLKDCLLTDAANLLIVPEGDLGTDFAAAGVGARWHLGFIKALASIWDSLTAAVAAEREKKDRPVWITGHSLGGALAVLAAWRFKRKFIPVHQIYTFGGPMVGSDDAAKAIDKEFAGKIFRYVNGPDPVPKLPTISLLANEYLHCQNEVALGVAEEHAATGAFFREWAGKTADGVLHGTIIDDIWQGLQGRLGAHAITHYRSLIEAMFNK